MLEVVVSGGGEYDWCKRCEAGRSYKEGRGKSQSKVCNDGRVDSLELVMVKKKKCEV